MTSKTITISTLVLFTSALLGCSSDPERNELVGAWQRASSDGAVEEWVFDEDGTFRFEEFESVDNDLITGTWEVRDGLLIMDGTDEEGSTGSYALTFFADESHFGFDALLPVGDTDGLIGTWAGSLFLEVIDVVPEESFTVDSAIELELRGDDTARMKMVDNRFEGPLDLEGTWGLDEERPTRFEAEFAEPGGNGTLSFGFEPLGDDEALAGQVYTRVVQ